METAIIDYGMSNLGSIRQALEECGGDPTVISDPNKLKTATKIILPGVGSFNDGMNNLKKMGWIEALNSAVIRDGVPLLGICLGMQLLADHGNEGGKTKGLGLIPGTVEKMVPHNAQERIPHVGWNEIEIIQENPIIEDVPNHTDFYFVHSYHFIPAERNAVICTTPYCDSFASVINHNNIYGTQFHPEKSQRPGFRVLENFLNL